MCLRQAMIRDRGHQVVGKVVAVVVRVNDPAPHAARGNVARVTEHAAGFPTEVVAEFPKGGNRMEHGGPGEYPQGDECARNVGSCEKRYATQHADPPDDDTCFTRKCDLSGVKVSKDRGSPCARGHQDHEVGMPPVVARSGTNVNVVGI